MEDNYYNILELDKNCSIHQIKENYKRLALKWHPDKNNSNRKEAENKFRVISKAYQILSNQESREKYDKFGITSSNTDNILDPSIAFQSLFEEEDIPNVIVRIEADINDLYHGFTEQVEYTRFSECIKCNATGTQNKKDGNCKKCSGKGILMETIKGGKIGYMFNESKCETCDGSGLSPDIPKCKKCSGNKYIKETIECDVDIPAGAYTNYFIKLENEGNYIPLEDRKDKNKDRTDVLFIIKDVTPKNNNIKRGMQIDEIKRTSMAHIMADMMIDVSISFEESICGIKKEIAYITDKKIGIETDEIILHNNIYVIENHGMPIIIEEVKDDKKYGDLFIRFRVDKPKLNEKQKKRLWQIITDTPYQVFDDIDNVKEIKEFDLYISEKKGTDIINNNTDSYISSDEDDKSIINSDLSEEENNDSDNENLEYNNIKKINYKSKN